MRIEDSTVTVSSTSFTSCSAVSVGSLVFVHQSEHHTGAHKHVIKIVSLPSDDHTWARPPSAPACGIAEFTRSHFVHNRYYYTIPFTCQT